MKLELKILNRKIPLFGSKSEADKKMESNSENIFDQIQSDIKMRAAGKLKLSDLIVVLESIPFKGEQYEDLIDMAALYDLERIKNETQASEDEIEKALSKHTIAVINGFYRLIDYEYEVQIMILILGEFEEKSWKVDEVDKEMLYYCLREDIQYSVFDALFKKYMEPSFKKKLDENHLYMFNIPKTTRLLAYVLLVENPKSIYDDFVAAWEMVCPAGMQPKPEYLYGMAITTWNCETLRKEILFLPESSLPTDLTLRIQVMFNTEEQWTHEEIRPYLSKYVSRELSLHAILSNYTDQMEENGVKFYTFKPQESIYDQVF